MFIDFQIICLFYFYFFWNLHPHLPKCSRKSERNTKKCLCKLILFERAGSAKWSFFLLSVAANSAEFSFLKLLFTFFSTHDSSWFRVWIVVRLKKD
jgi:hypothetical protein